MCWNILTVFVTWIQSRDYNAQPVEFNIKNGNSHDNRESTRPQLKSGVTMLFQQGIGLQVEATVNTPQLFEIRHFKFVSEQMEFH